MTRETTGTLKPYLDYRERGKDHDIELAYKRRQALKWLEAERARKAESSNVVSFERAER